MSKARKYFGKKIRALVNYPFGGHVKKGEEAELYLLGNWYHADFPSQKGYVVAISDKQLEEEIANGKIEFVNLDNVVETKYAELTIGMELSADSLTEWCNRDENICLNWKWQNLANRRFSGDRKIISLGEVISGVVSFSISGTSPNIFIRKEGFLDFLNGKTNPLTKETSLQKIKELVKQRTSGGIDEDSLQTLTKELFEMVKQHNSDFDDYVDYKDFLENVW